MSSKEKSFWIGFGVVMVLLLGASGIYMAQSLTAFNSVSREHGVLAGKKRKLESKPIFPSEENLEEFRKRLDSFEEQVNHFHSKLKQFQKPLENSLKAKDFPQILADAVVDFRKKPVKLPDDFYFGMNKYEKGGLPPEPATGILKFQLDAIQHLLNVAIDQGAEEIFRFDREVTPLEALDGKDPELTEQVAKYPVTVSFRTTHDGFRNFLNKVSNDTQFFYIVRVLRVDNESKDGPRKAGEQQSFYLNLVTREVVNEKPEGAAGADLVLMDARPIFGREKLLVTAVIDLCRFPEREESAAVPAAPGRRGA